MQVIEEYCKYADAMLGRWGANSSGTRFPNVRALVKPLLSLFHGSRGTKRWKNTIDALLLQSPTSASAVLLAAMAVLDDATLDEPPTGSAEPPRGGQPSLFSAAMTGEWPPSQVPPPCERAAAATSPAPPSPAASGGAPPDSPALAGPVRPSAPPDDAAAAPASPGPSASCQQATSLPAMVSAVPVAPLSEV